MAEVVSCKEFVSNGEKYFEKALNEQVFVRNGENIFVVMAANEPKPVQRFDTAQQPCVAEAKKYRKPDDDLRRAITMEEFEERVLKRLKEYSIKAGKYESSDIA
jgi:hypothetical protein